MDCPFCKRPMKKGYVPVGKGRLMWLAEGGVPPLTVFGEPENGVSRLPGVAMFHIEAGTARPMRPPSAP